MEILRQIAELMIWGDQHDRSFFDYFADQKIISHFVQLLYKPNVDRKVTLQVVQTLSILIGNIQESGSVFYLLSNNYINDLIVYPFDFEHEEMMAHYISFLKTLSLKLNSDTVQFLFNQEKGRFPLWEEAIKFFKHPGALGIFNSCLFFILFPHSPSTFRLPRLSISASQSDRSPIFASGSADR